MKHKMKKLICMSAMLSVLAASPGIAAAATYTVQPGDSLWKISVKHGTTVEQLMQRNGLKTYDLLVGQTLQVPDPQQYVTVPVESNDTMWKIALRYAVPLDKLIAANPQIPNPDIIWKGLEIRIPKKPAAYANGVFPLKAGTYSEYANSYAEARSWSPSGEEIRKHEGVDIMANEGAPVYSATSGTIVKAGWNEYGGWRVTIRVDDNTEMYYAHLSGYASGIKEGAKVSAGQPIGYVGSTGYGPEGTSGKFLPHLHFGMYKRTPSYHSVDPYLCLKWWEL
ncbi:M23 family metallopeptidase [Paenibacillus sp. J5C_2022]|uniref:M23 family metallopeptidase n=1 Tax=Paenibacillus sp. J5C2022 TaxID=2977129 RepID=UPI0021CF64F1|nr:M23 family metallopeptidase [Paenibacillus sp. J5C2022]MCU6712934.1 M23 family metallopeptidase [Paenibacillus sp. J5C2022]